MVGLLMPISDRLKELREKKGMTQEGLARAAKLTVSTVAKLEAEKIKDPGVLTLRKIARALGVTLDELAGDENGGEEREAEGKPKKPRKGRK